MSLLTNPSNRMAQGTYPVETIERPELKLFWYNDEGKKVPVNGDSALNILGAHFVKMPIQNIYFKIKDDGNINFLKPISEARMLVLLNDLGIKNRSQRKDLLNCDEIREISALSIIYESIKLTQWDGIDRITKVVDDMNLSGNKEENVALIRRWFLNTYSVAFNYIDPDITWSPEPRVVFILHSDQRMWGKTAILGFLGMEGVLKQTIPQLNVEVYSLLRGQLPEDKLELNAFLGHSLIINIDDIQNLLNSPDGNKRAMLRSLTTQKQIANRKMYAEGTRHSIRRAGLCGSTNNKSVLRDTDENRYMVFTLKDKVCFDTVNEDGFLMQFWAQIQQEAIADGRKCNFTHKETDIIIKRSQKFMFKTDLEQYIEDNYKYSPYARELTFREVRRDVLNDDGGIHATDKQLRLAIERIIPSGGDYSNKSGSTRYLTIEKIDSDHTPIVKGGDGLPF